MQTTPMVACDTNGHTYSRLAFTAQRGECAATVQMQRLSSRSKDSSEDQARLAQSADGFVLSRCKGFRLVLGVKTPGMFF
jgi:hypothetical protein